MRAPDLRAAELRVVRFGVGEAHVAGRATHERVRRIWVERHTRRQAIGDGDAVLVDLPHVNSGRARRDRPGEERGAGQTRAREDLHIDSRGGAQLLERGRDAGIHVAERQPEPPRAVGQVFRVHRERALERLLAGVDELLERAQRTDDEAGGDFRGHDGRIARAGIARGDAAARRIVLREVVAGRESDEAVVGPDDAQAGPGRVRSERDRVEVVADEGREAAPVKRGVDVMALAAERRIVAPHDPSGRRVEAVSRHLFGFEKLPVRIEHRQPDVRRPVEAADEAGAGVQVGHRRAAGGPARRLVIEEEDLSVTRHEVGLHLRACRPTDRNRRRAAFWELSLAPLVGRGEADVAEVGGAAGCPRDTPVRLGRAEGHHDPRPARATRPAVAGRLRVHVDQLLPRHDEPAVRDRGGRVSVGAKRRRPLRHQDRRLVEGVDRRRAGNKLGCREGKSAVGGADEHEAVGPEDPPDDVDMAGRRVDRDGRTLVARARQRGGGRVRPAHLERWGPGVAAACGVRHPDAAVEVAARLEALEAGPGHVRALAARHDRGPAAPAVARRRRKRSCLAGIDGDGRLVREEPLRGLRALVEDAGKVVVDRLAAFHVVAVRVSRDEDRAVTAAVERQPAQIEPPVGSGHQHGVAACRRAVERRTAAHGGRVERRAGQERRVPGAAAILGKGESNPRFRRRLSGRRAEVVERRAQVPRDETVGALFGGRVERHRHRAVIVHRHQDVVRVPSRDRRGGFVLPLQVGIAGQGSVHAAHHVHVGADLLRPQPELSRESCQRCRQQRPDRPGSLEAAHGGLVVRSCA